MRTVLYRPRARGRAGRRERRAAARRGGAGPATSEEDCNVSDSAFPAHTPDNVRALDDLLEEEVAVPGDSGRGSIFPGHPGWAFLGNILRFAFWRNSPVKNIITLLQIIMTCTFPNVKLLFFFWTINGKEVKSM